jgi:hypothetical protein
MGATLPPQEGTSLETLSPCFSVADEVNDLLGISDFDLFKKGSLLQPAPAAEADIPVELDEGFINSGIAEGTDLSDNKNGLFLIGTSATGSPNRSPS